MVQDRLQGLTDEEEEHLKNLAELNLKILEGYYRILFVMEAFTSLMIKKGVMTTEELEIHIEEVLKETQKRNQDKVDNVESIKKSVEFGRIFGTGEFKDA